MAQHDYVIANQSGSAFRADLNNALAASVSINSGSSAPSTTYAYMLWADTTNNVIKLRNSANNAWITLFTTTGGLSISAASTFNDDVTFDGATAGRDMVWDRSDNALEFGTYAQIKLADQASIRCGTHEDLKIFHSGANAHITHVSEGNMFIDAVANINFRNEDGTAYKASFEDEGSCKLYYDNSKKLATHTNGVHMSGSMYFPDDQIAGFGDVSNPDLRIYHNGTENRVWAANGSLDLRTTDANNVEILTNGSYSVWCETDGMTALYHDGARKFETTTTGALVGGGLAIGANAAANTINVSGASGSSQTTLYYGFGTIDLTAGSDERIKNNIVPTAKGLDDILKLRIVDFTYTPEYSDDSTTVRTGGIAQEWQKVDPNLVNAKNEDLLFIEYKRVIPHLIKAVQELSDKVTALEAK